MSTLSRIRNPNYARRFRDDRVFKWRRAMLTRDRNAPSCGHGGPREQDWYDDDTQVPSKAS